MSKMTPEEKEEYRKAVSESVIKSASDYDGTATFRHWRAWGSWFSWGSPVGLGLFIIALAVAVWIFSQAV